MLKKFLTCFSLLVVLTLATTVQAKSVELTGINAFELDKQTVRIEISYRGGKLDRSDISDEYSLKGIKLVINNAKPGRLSRISGSQIQPEARNFIEKIDTKEDKKKSTSVQIKFKSVIESGSSKIMLEPVNNAEKKDARIMIDVKRIVPNDDDNWTPTQTPPEEEFTNGDGKVIVLDPGHGGSDSGAVGPSGVTEKSVSLAVSLKAQKLLANSGYHVIMTRTTDIDVAAPGVPDGVELQARVDKSPPNTALFISVHCNAFSNSRANGMETFYAPNATKGARLARLLNEELERLGGLNNRGVKSARFYVMTHSKCPASLIELGFITNHREEKLLASDDYQQKLAQAITNAVNRYFNQGGSD